VTPTEELLGLAVDVDRLLIVGVAAAGGDSLRRRGKTLRELGAKVPALVPVADAVERVAGADRPAPVFLDLLVTTRQLRAGLASAGVDGPLTPLPSSGPWRTPVATRDLRPVYGTLTRSGSGREERVKEAVAKNLFGDLRLALPLLAALDGNTRAADAAAEHGLPALGVAILDELRASLHPDGKAPDARRLRAVCRIDPKTGAALCRQALLEGSPSLRAEALTRLPEVAAGEAEEMGLKFHKDKNKDVRVAALRSLGTATSEEALTALLDGLDDPEYLAAWAAHDSLAAIRHPEAAARLLAELRRLLAILDEPAPKAAPGKAKGGKKALARTLSERESVRDRAYAVVSVLGKRKDGDLRAAARTILPLLRDEECDDDSAPVKALGAFGPVIPEIVPALVDLLASKDDDRAVKAITILSDFPPAKWEAAIPALVNYVESGVRKYRYTPLEAFALLSKQTKRHADEVFRAAQAALRCRAARDCCGGQETVLEGLGNMGPRAKPLLPAVFDGFRRAELIVHSGLFKGHDAVARIDPAGNEAIPALIGLLDHKKPMPKVLALQSLAAYGPKARQAIPEIERLAAVKGGLVSLHAGEALAAIRGES
jgi:HEAT repeat protein